MKQTTELDRACSAFRIAMAKNEFCYQEAVRKADRQSMEFYRNQLRWNKAVDSLRKQVFWPIVLSAYFDTTGAGNEGLQGTT